MVRRLGTVVTLLTCITALAVAQKDVPLIGLNAVDDSPVDHGCTLTGNTVRGSTHWFHHFPEPNYWPNSTVPDLPEVECDRRPPAAIIQRSIEWEPVGAYRSYYIRFLVRINREGVGRYDIGGVGPCGKRYRGLSGYRRQRLPGDYSEVFCFALGNKYYDAHAELAKVINDAELCRVVFLDRKGMKGEYHQAWYNHDEPVCDNMRAIDTGQFCAESNWWVHPYASPPEDLCGNCTNKSGISWTCPQ